MSGKASFDHIYTQPDPRAYFRVLRTFDYCIPQLAKPYFSKLIQERSLLGGGGRPVRVLDIGCSYGINAALLKCDATMDELYDRYCDARASDVLPLDREFVRRRAQPGQRVRFTGLDASAEALTYARQAGFLDAAVHADLERQPPTPLQSARLAGADLIVSTGCIGYVTERTLTHVVEAQGGRLPWMAHFVLRMFPFRPIARTLSGLGYRTTRVEGVFKQRRFASEDEQTQVLQSMSAAGVDAQDLEAEGWLYAQLYVSRPHDEPGE
ncbi:class I SAM-dependent methyltransferase [Streptomyces sp. A7024]|uniref:Class I SAM-dependent methyltransferase n=1 Tax=Streptomyces coryli TaxID=1128680 RepID=A0A6G4UCY0_9ACTN|nr:class I SAM-dependent methyltransferase [Streptomyces coryli]NGN70095.1 class I SAM-dependent methyltransferase [Streptomyces coryli]